MARLGRVSAGQLGTGIDLAVRTAALLGGIAFTGGGIFRAVVGVLLLGLLATTILTMLGRTALRDHVAKTRSAA